MTDNMEEGVTHYFGTSRRLLFSLVLLCGSFITTVYADQEAFIQNSNRNGKVEITASKALSSGQMNFFNDLKSWKTSNSKNSSVLVEFGMWNVTDRLILNRTMLNCGNSDTPKRDYDQVYCNMTWDGISCWPTTPGGDFATIECPHMDYVDHTKNASKYCHENGTWEGKADYTSCLTTNIPTDSEELAINYACRVIYNLGFIISTLALGVALFIFLHFRSLRCLRNKIHSHLIVSFIIRNLVWLLMQHSLLPIVESQQTWACKMETTVYNYVQMTNFFWMLVEGLYLHIIIVWTYSADKIKLWYFIIIGWGIPSIFIIIWVSLRVHFGRNTAALSEHDACWLPRANNTIDNDVDHLDFVYNGPILFVLAINMLYLATIIWVLVTKLRASHSLETRQLRKAVKATLLLFPLLGITYVIFIWPPSNALAVLEAHQFINAFLQSFQGFFVALFYCFLNGEVKSVLKKKFSVFQDSRTLSARYTKSTIGWANDSSIAPKEAMSLSNGENLSTYNGHRASMARDRRDISQNPEETENML